MRRRLLYCCIAAAFGCAPTPDGSPGSAGNNGTAGTSGSAGTTGSAGSAGSAGTTGSAGSGVAGTSGSAGDSGTAGTTGTAGISGTSGSGGSGGSATGTAGRGGTTGTAGRGGTTGTAGTTGTGGASGGSTGTGGTGTATCSFTQSSAISTKIGTVGIVTWSTTMAGATSAKIDFGLTTSYGMTAPIAAVQASNRTLLLGMKTSRMYNYKITVMGSGAACESPNYTIMTGSLPTGLMKPTVSPATATGLSGGFLITALYQGTPTTAFILDVDGDYVWAYGGIGGQLTGARMSYDGQYMWINNANVPNGSAMVRRVSMDGLTDDNYSSKFTGMNHQIAILPDETVAYYAYGSNGCDDVKEFKPSGAAPNGTGKTVVNSKTALKINDGMCHLNNIQYSKEDDSLVFSNLQSSQIAKVKRSDGSTVWIMNGSTSTISGITWSGGNHGIHLLSLNRLLIFNNNNGGAGGSIAKEYMFSGSSGSQIWSYTASPAQANMVMGDLQRMPNGNTVVAYSTRGVIDEVNAQGTLLQRMTAAGTGNFGYIEKRLTLYGPPPR